MPLTERGRQTLADLRAVFNAIDRLAIEVLDAETATEPDVSPAYVRRLRDQAVMRMLANPRPEDVEQARVVAKNNKGDFEGTVRAMLSLWAVELADAGLYALGYDAPTATGRPPETERPARNPKTEENR